MDEDSSNVPPVVLTPRPRPNSVAAYRFPSRAGAWAYQGCVVGFFVILPIVVFGWPWLPPAVLMTALGVLVASAIANQVLFATAAKRGNAAKVALFNGPATRAGRACWRAASRRRHREGPDDRAFPEPERGEVPMVFGRADGPTRASSTAFIALVVAMLLMLLVLIAVLIFGHTVATVNPVDLPAGTPWQAISRDDGTLDTPTVDCPSLASWITGERPPYCGNDAVAKGRILLLSVVLAGGVAAAIRVLVTRRRQIPPTTEAANL